MGTGKTFQDCHSERSEESQRASCVPIGSIEILRCAQNDNLGNRNDKFGNQKDVSDFSKGLKGHFCKRSNVKMAPETTKVMAGFGWTLTAPE
jgi:hypothetical protein